MWLISLIMKCYDVAANVADGVVDKVAAENAVYIAIGLIKTQ